MRNNRFFYPVIILVIILVVGYFLLGNKDKVQLVEPDTYVRPETDEPKVPFYPCNESVEKCS